MRRRLAALSGIALLVAVLVAGGVYAGLATSPESVAKRYVSDVGRNDAAAVWNDIEVSRSGSSTQHLTDQSALVAMMALSENRHSGRSAIAINGSETTGSRATVTVTWEEQSQAESQRIVLERAGDTSYVFFPDWRVMVKPSNLSFNLPSVSATVTVDGVRVAAEGTVVKVDVFPGAHRLAVSASSMFEPTTQTMTATDDSSPITLNLTPTDATGAGIRKAIGDAFARCAAATTASPSGCPQSSTDTGTGFTWKPVGDPTTSLALSIDSSGNVHAIGHYVMLYTFTSSFPDGVRHRFVAGPYEAIMRSSATGISVDGLSQVAKGPQLSPPTTVVDADVKNSVAAAFTACTAAPSGGSPDCPQFDFAFQASNFGWTIKGDPLDGATVTFDPDQGIWKVSGNYAFHDSYNTSIGHQEHDLSGTYLAYVINDGSKVATVYIRKV